MRKAWSYVVGVALAAVASSATGASGVQLGTQGLAAFDRQDYAGAIRLFTLALKAKDLKASDRELAYLKRGEAELDLGQVANGIRDLHKALELKPDDVEASQFLQLAESAPPPVPSASVSKQSTLSRSQRIQAAWGAMARLPGHTWLEIDDKPTMYFQYQWEQPWKVMTFTGMDKNGNPFAGQYQLDEATSQISGVAVFKGQAGQSQVQTTADTWVAESQSGSSQTRQTFQVSGATAFQLTQTWLKGSKWYQGKPMQYVQVSPTVIAGLGWTTAPPQPSFWAGLLSSMKAGAIAGFQDGIHDGIHDRTQCGIAGKRTQAPGCTTAQ